MASHSQNVEIERKFLVDSNAFETEKQDNSYRFAVIQQGYWTPENLPAVFEQALRQLSDSIEHRDYAILQELGTDHLEMRVRQSDEDYYVTFKGRKSLSTGGIHEFEYKLPEKWAVSLLNSCDFLISKTRYYVPLDDNLTIEVDAFNHLDGLVMAEVEIPSIHTVLPALPSWIGEEVTGNETYYNRSLAERHKKPNG